MAIPALQHLIFPRNYEKPAFKLVRIHPKTKTIFIFLKFDYLDIYPSFRRAAPATILLGFDKRSVPASEVMKGPIKVLRLPVFTGLKAGANERG